MLFRYFLYAFSAGENIIQAVARKPTEAGLRAE
jgi:hypothetical protein